MVATLTLVRSNRAHFSGLHHRSIPTGTLQPVLQLCTGFYTLECSRCDFPARSNANSRATNMRDAQTEDRENKRMQIKKKKKKKKTGGGGGPCKGQGVVKDVCLSSCWIV